ncbi:MAG: Trk system potassium transporter TrkA [Gammaproteobacteria bacterium]|nr:Trk system potassium transporter TrkA [Rhodocyclaceae bacterium]MBU3909255.1 Trk system potassium transporter TrkA [Gammaproteobacteria bacterium]MBU3989637.1 Trk system potassium transporter TrkA [Gammaproteobacteria bacterium]MBU4005585.1 Trk system potassium transporter TrkA [Gammaproteobacteria bacterium]MBU4020862.1 Trk system potassium transporter TrkA [Gammaproteobacteria bacterium]
MRIVILGAGQVGASVTEALSSEANDITVVDRNHAALAELADRLDVRTVTGDAAYPSVLREAGIEDADMLVAVTQSDQTNLVACKIARSIFHVPTRIARLRAHDLLDPVLLSNDNFAVDYAICPEQDITDYIVKLIEFPEALQVLEFADGNVTLIGVRAFTGGLLVGKPIHAMREHLPSGVDARIAAIFREHQPIEPDGHTVIEPGDEVFVIAASAHIRLVLKELRRSLEPVKRVMIAGGGNIGLRVASTLGSDYQVKLIELDQRRAESIAGKLDNTLVLVGEATDEDLLAQENIDETDLFLALTNDDEDNIMAASLAKRLGCKRVLALINRRAYADMVQGGPIDIGLSPAQVSIGALLTHVRRGDVAKVHSLRRGAAEALELIAHGDKKTSKVVGRRIDELPVIKGAHIGAIVRRSHDPEVLYRDGLPSKEYIDRVIIPHHDTVIESDDHVIVFCTRKREVTQVEKLFQVGFHFL